MNNGTGDMDQYRPKMETPRTTNVRFVREAGGVNLSEFEQEVKKNVLKLGEDACVDISRGSVVSNRAFYEEPQFEVHAVFRLGKKKENKIPEQELVRDWCKISRNSTQFHNIILIQLTSPDGLPRNAINVTLPVKLSSFGFGALMCPGLFIEHGTFSPENAWTEWEHDTSKMMLKFWRRNEETEATEGYKIEFEYHTLNSVTTDVLLHGEVEMYFVLRHTPKIWKAVPPGALKEKKEDSDMDDEERQKAELDRARRTEGRERRYKDLEWRDWWRVQSFPGCAKEVVANMNAVRLRIKPWQSLSDFGRKGGVQKPVLRQHSASQVAHTILGRLRIRGRIKHISFGPVHVFRPCYKQNFHVLVQKLESELMEEFKERLEISFSLFAILKRGYFVLNQLIDCPETKQEFIEAIHQYSRMDISLTENALEQLLAALDGNKTITLIEAFQKIFMAQFEYIGPRNDSESEDRAEGAEEGEFAFCRVKPDPSKELPKGCVLVRKVIVTPTRILPLGREVMAGNRVVRQYGIHNALRLAFRDEDGSSIAFRGKDIGRAESVQDGERPPLLDNLVRSTMLGGIKLGGYVYNFLAWSNSQMRDHSAYFYRARKTEDEPGAPSIAKMRQWMGDFTANKNVPKYLARMAQCFTQAVVGKTLSAKTVACEKDVLSNERDPENGQKYVYSDGIGRISFAFAKEIAKNLHIEYVPCAFQIRYQGYKGMLSVDPKLEGRVIFRESMKKFKSVECHDLEIVKYSMPSSVYLNKPLTMILDQQSAANGRTIFGKVTNRIHQLLENEIFALGDMLLNEGDCVYEVTDRLPVRLNFIQLKNAGFSLTSEPFFRRLNNAIFRYRIKQHLLKLKVEIPPHLGRTAYGILDETKTLVYGEVFFQFSRNIRKPSGKKRVYTGKIMITKNPCIHSGDVRIMEAVDRPELAHYCDVLVFPSRPDPQDPTRDRPHSDEMAGSDLDGDEYAIFMDPQMMFRENSDAMDFPKFKQRDEKKPIEEKAIVEFFLSYMKQDSVGRMSIAHLVAADREKDGLFSEACLAIAKKVSMAVDFPKSGKPADHLEEDEQAVF